MNLLNFGFSSPIKLPTIDVLTSETPFVIGTAKDMSKRNYSLIYFWNALNIENLLIINNNLNLIYQKVNVLLFTWIF